MLYTPQVEDHSIHSYRENDPYYKTIALTSVIVQRCIHVPIIFLGALFIEVCIREKHCIDCTCMAWCILSPVYIITIDDNEGERRV